jgi:polysaccharide pyruvyl transferase WcaK-like protein
MKTRPPRHLLVAYSWSLNNIGDVGITPGLLNLVRQTEPSARAVVLTSQAAGDPAVHFQKGYLPRYLPGCKVVANPFGFLLDVADGKEVRHPAWRSLVGKWGSRRLEAFQRGCLAAADAEGVASDLLDRFPSEVFRQLARENPAAAAAFRRARFVIYNSGTTLNFGRLGVRNLWGYTLLWLMPLILARWLKVPYGINAQSFDAVDWPVDLVHRPLLRDAAFVYCRDGDSLAYLKQRDLLCRRTGFRPDSTFFFNGFDEPWADAFMKRHRLEDRRFLALAVRIPAEVAHYHDPAGGVLSRERRELHLRKLADFIVRWVRETGQPVLLSPETRAVIQPSRELLHARLPAAARKRCLWLDRFWTTEQAYSIYRRAQMVVSMEMHSIIMAINVGTPALHVPFREAGRKAWMMNDLGFPDWLLDLDDVPTERLLGTALGVHRRPEASRRRVQAALPRLKRLATSVLREAAAVSLR